MGYIGTDPSVISASSITLTGLDTSHLVVSVKSVSIHYAYNYFTQTTAGTTYTVSFEAANLIGNMDVFVATDYLRNNIMVGSTVTNGKNILTFTSAVTGSYGLFFGSTWNITSVDITNIQLEALSFASSYIPTTGVPVTRAADSLNIPLIGNWIYDDISFACVISAEDYNYGTIFSTNTTWA